MQREHMRVQEESKTEARKVRWVRPDGPDDVGGPARQRWGWPDKDGDGRTKMGMNPDSTWVAAKLARPCKAAPGGGTGAAVPGPSTTHSSMAPALGAIIFPLVPSLGIRSLTQDDDVIIENAATVPQASLAHATATVSSTSSVHNTAPVPLASMVYITAMVPQALSVNAAAMVPQALLVNAAATVLEASSAYDTALVPLASSVSATAMVPQASLVTTTGCLRHCQQMRV